MVHADQHDALSLHDDAHCWHVREDANDGGELVQ